MADPYNDRIFLTQARQRRLDAEMQKNPKKILLPVSHQPPNINSCFKNSNMIKKAINNRKYGPKKRVKIEIEIEKLALEFNPKLTESGSILSQPKYTDLSVFLNR